MKSAWILLPALLLGAGTAQGAIETWVSGTGSDAGTCQITAPCRTFAYAHSQTNNNGAINVLSSGNFGPLTITKPISIVAQGVEAVINSGASGAAILVQTGSTGVVSLRGLTIDLRLTANNGITFGSGAALHVQNCVIRKAVHGILFQPASGIRELYLADSLIADTGDFGILVSATGSAGSKAVLDRVRVENSGGNGIAFTHLGAGGPVMATVRDSIVAGSLVSGISATGSMTKVLVSHTASNYNGSVGIGASFGATVRVGDSTVTGNATGLFAGGGVSPGVIESYGTNKVDGNGTDVSGTITPVSPK